MIKVVHILDALTGAGPTRSLLALAKIASEHGLAQQHRVITLRPEAYPIARFQAKQLGIEVLRSPDEKMLQNEIQQADIVQIHYWNNPVYAEFLRKDLPESRFLIWFKIFGKHPPQVITRQMLSYCDFALVSSPLSLRLPVFKSKGESWLQERSGVVYGLADWTRLRDLQPKKHDTFNVGYIGTVNFSKMHPRFVQMSAGIDLQTLKCIVCGGGIEEILKEQAGKLNALDRFDFRGYVEDIRSVLEILDVFGYPLCEDTYAASEKSIQEAMYAGVPPVVFPYGGCTDLVQHEETGLVVRNETEYQQAIEYLYHHPEERKRLGENAARYARTVFDSTKSAEKMQDVYERIIRFPKRKRTWESEIEAGPITGSDLFIDMLGDRGASFQNSKNETDSELLLKADEQIAQSSPLLAGGEGGIFQYRNAYPDDPYLRLWAGLVLQKRRDHIKAMRELDAAIDLNLDQWRILWYKGQSAFEVEELDISKKLLTTVLEINPDFDESRDLLSKIISK